MSFTYVEIPQHVLDAGYKCPVHVKGWNISYRFTYSKTLPNGNHVLFSKRSGRMVTSKPLLYTQRNTPRR